MQRRPAICGIALGEIVLMADQFHDTLFCARHACREDVQLYTPIEQHAGNVILARILCCNESPHPVFVFSAEQHRISIKHGAYLSSVAGADGVEKLLTHAYACT